MAEATVQLNETVLGYEFTPDGQRRAPAIIVIHEVMGLVDYIKEVARNLSDSGYVAMAVDLFEGKTAKGMEDGRPLRDKVTEEVFKTKIDAGIRYLESRPYICWKNRGHWFLYGRRICSQDRLFIPAKDQVPVLSFMEGSKTLSSSQACRPR